MTLWSVVFQVADDAGLDVVRHGEQCSGKSKSATAAAARRAVRSAPKAKYVNSNAFHLDTATFPLVKSILKILSSFLKVCGLQFGRALQVQHSRQPRHRLHQELRSVCAFSFLSPLFLPCSNALTHAPLRQQHV